MQFEGLSKKVRARYQLRIQISDDAILQASNVSEDDQKAPSLCPLGLDVASIRRRWVVSPTTSVIEVELNL